MMGTDSRNTVFVSYSHADAGWLQRLRKHLAPLLRDQVFDLWDDTKILPGHDWRKQIENALARARVAVLLISADFLASDFISSEELPRLLTAAEAGGVTILPVIVSASRFADTPALSRFQAVNAPDRPLNGLGKAAQERVLVAVSEAVERAFTTPIGLEGPRPDVGDTRQIRSLTEGSSPGGQQKAATTTSSSGDLEEVGVADKLEGYVIGAGNVDLYWQGWLPRGPVIGLVLLCHGAGEHSGRYRRYKNNVVDTLAPDGWAVYGMDLRGHGRSSGEPVHVEDFSDWVVDFDVFRRKVTARHRDLPVFVLGHSLGGQIALAYALHHQDDLRGLVLSAPYLAANVPPIKQKAGRFAARFLRKQRFRLVDFDKISKDAAVVDDYQHDQRVYHGYPTLAMAVIVASQFDPLIKNSRSLHIPVLIQHGMEDKIAKVDGSQRLYRACGSADKTIRLYPGLWHEIYNEPEGLGPLNDLREWLASHK